MVLLRPFFWPIWIFVSVLITVRFVRYLQFRQSGMYEIDNMNGSEFENRLAILFKNLGYSVRHTGQTGDAGVDLIIERNGKKTAVQAKCYSSSRVGEDAVQQVFTGKAYYRCDDAIIVTNNNFTKMAWKVANSIGVKLWSRNYLIKVLLTEKEKLGQAPKYSFFWLLGKI